MIAKEIAAVAKYVPLPEVHPTFRRSGNQFRGNF